ncbi:ABC transporter ATP-binding protein [Paramicrobacterium agarici]|uniref:ABC-type multidrug transport system fused ATPase/permease subunit n=1 Tax=Paramicrobacterium agarici TaxID=630514 RepID=A0A2A9E140_9MICO|nr:ABC transporter ATP-binding protein [Microbacterium agarici]PFG31890.1 ABC-type multidrug transport system fused ATPase/permease subunit [Microbacterium agarici]
MKALYGLYRDVLNILPGRAKRFLTLYSVGLGILAILDAAALGVLAIVITPLISQTTITLPIVGEVGGPGLIGAIALVCALIVFKGVGAVALLRIATKRFATYELELGTMLFESFTALPWTERLKKNSSDIVRLTDGSVGAIVAGFLLPGSTLLGESLSFIAVVVVLAVAQPVVAIITLVYMGLLGLLLYIVVAKRSRQAGKTNLKYTLQTSRLITEMVGALKEVTLRNKLAEVSDVVRAGRVHSSRARADVQFYGQVPRYVLEAGIVGGFVLVGIAGFIGGGLEQALAAIAMFGLAGFRVAPSIVRVQTIVNKMTANAPHAEIVLREIQEGESAKQAVSEEDTAEIPTRPSAIALSDVSFSYGNDNVRALDSVNFTVPFGSTVAFVGSSGAGKSTMIDLILGLISPTVGTVSLDETDLRSIRRAWRSRVGYVPQDVALFDATVAQNVALSWTDDVDNERVREVLAQAQLLETIEARPGGINAPIGERGLSLSGGQRQRLGIARALYGRPLVLVMDEATSALDSRTEAAVSRAISELQGEVTVILVAHRLSTIKDADQIFFLRDGRVDAQGTFSELVRDVPDFAEQAALSGLGNNQDGKSEAE